MALIKSHPLHMMLGLTMVFIPHKDGHIDHNPGLFEDQFTYIFRCQDFFNRYQLTEWPEIRMEVSFACFTNKPNCG
ncbi:MAG: hypothetical protein BroJett018_21650 [Chloroflexota bacterium]|nr:hypothetical protein [Chloroflexota bacterium]GIK64371.1 MAG: hypothetical protein BroJett018_21650 [Chloroflexota bacterium]